MEKEEMKMQEQPTPTAGEEKRLKNNLQCLIKNKSMKSLEED